MVVGVFLRQSDDQREGPQVTLATLEAWRRTGVVLFFCRFVWIALELPWRVPVELVYCISFSLPILLAVLRFPSQRATATLVLLRRVHRTESRHGVGLRVVVGQLNVVLRVTCSAYIPHE